MDVGYINLTFMFGKKEKVKKTKEEKHALKVKKHAEKLEKKKQKLLAPKESKKQVSLKKHITALPFVGSKIITGFSGFLAAAAFYQFEVPHDYKFAGILAGATLLSSAIGAAPYMKSVARTNSTLSSVVNDLDKIDTAIGSQQQLVSQIITQVENILQQKGIAPEIQHIKAQLANLQKSLDGMKGESPQSPQVQNAVHTSPQNGKKNIVAE
jgi:hypothetical protein